VVVLVIVLLATNVVTLGVLAYLRLHRTAVPEPDDPAVRATLEALDAVARRGGAPPRDRQVISIEILNPLELAGSRGRMLGLAGTVAPGFTRRLVYDQTVKTLRRQLVEHGVVADVHVHAVRRADGRAQPATSDRHTLLIGTGDAEDYVDEIDRPVERDQPPA
jgi:hypothetical protein